MLLFSSQADAKNIQRAHRYDHLWQRRGSARGAVGPFVKESTGNVCAAIVFVAVLLYLDNQGESHKGQRARVPVALVFRTVALPGQGIDQFSLPK